MVWARTECWFLSSSRHLLELVVWAFDSCPKKRVFQLKKKGKELRSPLSSHQKMTVQKGDAAVTSSGCQASD